jgi:hypothetical protein
VSGPGVALRGRTPAALGRGPSAATVLAPLMLQASSNEIAHPDL